MSRGIVISSYDRRRIYHLEGNGGAEVNVLTTKVENFIIPTNKIVNTLFDRRKDDVFL